MAAADTARLIASLELRDKEFLAAIKRSTGAVDTLEKRLSRVGGIAAGGIRKAGQNLERGLAVGALAAGGAIAFAVTKAVDLESAMAGVNKTVSGTPEELKQITDGLVKMSNRLPVTAVDLAAIAENAGALGVATKDVLSFTETVALLGTTTNVTTDEAATALGQLTNVIGLTGDEYDNFAASLVDLGNKGASTEAQILEIARRSGAAAKLVGIAKEETLGWAAAAANLGIEQELAGTSLQNLFLKTQNLVSGGGKNMALFAKISGKSAKQVKSDFAEDAGGALEDFLKGLGELPKDARLKAVQKLFGKGSGLTRLILGLSDSIDQNLTPSLNTATSAWQANTAATAEAEKRFATSAAQLQILHNNIDNAAATIGSALLPVLNELAKEGVTWLQDPATQAGLKAFSQDLAKGAREAVTWLKSLDWDAIANALKAAGGFAKGLVDAFLAAPPWVQEFLAVGFVANKFTGGAITSILGELGKGLIKGVLGMNAGVVNINAATVNGGIPGGGVPGGGGKNLLAKAANFASKVVIVGMVAEVADLIHGAISPGGGLQGRIETNTQLPTDQLQWPFGPKNTPKLDFGPFANILGGDSGLPGTEKLNTTFERTSSEQARLQNVANERLESIRAQQAASGSAAITDSQSERAAIAAAAQVQATEERTSAQRTVGATERAEATATQKANEIKAAQVLASQLAAGDSRSERTAIANAASAQAAAQARTTEAARTVAAEVRDKDLSVSIANTINTRVQVSVRETIDSTTTHKQYQRYLS